MQAKSYIIIYTTSLLNIVSVELVLDLIYYIYLYWVHHKTRFLLYSYNKDVTLQVFFVAIGCQAELCNPHVLVLLYFVFLLSHLFQHI